MTTEQHSKPCSWPECPKKVPVGHWGCQAHWCQLPRPIRDAIYSAAREMRSQGLVITPAYVRASHDAQTWIQSYLDRSTTPPPPAEPVEEPDIKRYARLVRDTLNIQRRYFDGDRSPRVMGQCKDAEKKLRRATDYILGDVRQPTLFKAE